ncbi:MAG: type II toxin-antitoxin system RelE/ParE family toxin [Bacteroidales bacterium]
MSYNILTIPPFDRQLKRLAKKYPSIKSDITGLARQIMKDPATGKPLGKDCYKIRMAIKSKGKGKSGGARVITHFVVAGGIIYMLTIYDKSDKEDISDKELEELLKFIE